MKYASEVIDLMGCYPGREFVMGEIVRHATKGKALTPAKRQAVRIGIRRVLDSLIDSGQIMQIKETETSSVYVWRVKLTHEARANCYAN